MDDRVYFDQQDVNDNKVIVIISLIIGILFFLPLLTAPQSRYGKFFANQGLLLFIASAISTVIGKIPLIGWIVSAVLNLIFLIFRIIAIVNAANGEGKYLPIIGRIEIIK